MLSDLDIDNLIEPFVDRQHLIEKFVIELIAKHVKELGQALPSDIHRLERLYRSGSDAQAINREIAKITGLQIQQIRQLIRAVAADSYKDAKPFYDYRHKPYIPFAKNTEIQELVKVISDGTAKSFMNLSNSKATGFVIRDLKHPNKKRFYNIQDTYKTVIDEAVQAASQGIVDYNTTMRRTMKQLNESGIKNIEWESGYTQRTDSAVRRNILDGIRWINQKLHQLLGNKIGADGYELTAHHAPAPDHAPFQGHIFTVGQYEKLQNNKDFRDVNGNKFHGVERVIGQWNCKHFAYPIIIGVSQPRYTDEELQDILDENEKGITLSDGRHMTLYEATQYQNQLALKVRQAKEGVMMAQDCGNPNLAKEYQAKVNKYTNLFHSFNKEVAAQTDIWDERRDKIVVSGYHKIPA